MKDILKMFITTLPIYVVLFFLFKPSGDLTKKEMLNMLNQRDSIIAVNYTSKGEKVITHTNREYTPFIIQNSDNSEFVELRRDLKELGIKVKDLKSAINISSQASGSGTTKIVKVTDTLDTYTFEDSTGKHLKIKGKVDVSSGLLKYDYTYNSSYKIISYNYKKKLFKRPELRLKIVSSDTSNLINAKTFTMKPPIEYFSIGVGVGVGAFYDAGKVKIRPSIQIGIFKSLYTFRRKK